MACDGRLSTDDGDIHTDSYVKIRDCGRYIVGLCGDAMHFEAVWKWYANGCKHKTKPPGAYSSLAFDKHTGSLHTYEMDADSCIFLPDGEATAIGAGANLARVALMCGKGAAEAIKIVEQFQSGTGGKISTLKCCIEKKNTTGRGKAPKKKAAVTKNAA